MHIYVIKYICLKSQENYKHNFRIVRKSENKGNREIQKYVPSYANKLTAQLGGGSLEHVLF